MENRWRKMCSLIDQRINQLKNINAVEAMELEQKLASLTLRPRHSVTSPGDTELPIAEFRLLHQKIIGWMNSIEAKLNSSSRPSDDLFKTIEKEMEENKLKIKNLNESFRDLSFQPEILSEIQAATKNVNERWALVCQSVDRLKLMKDKSLLIPQSTSPSSDANVGDEEIDTLPEDDVEDEIANPIPPVIETFKDLTPPAKVSNESPIKLRTPSVVSSPKVKDKTRASPPTAMFEPSKRGNGGPHRDRTKAYPSPKWFVNSSEHQIKPRSDLTSPERVRVVVNMLPSPQKTSVPKPMTITTELTEPSEPQKPETAIIANSSLSSVATSSSVGVAETLEFENAAIDKILSETNANLQEVIKRSKNSGSPARSVSNPSEGKDELNEYIQCVKGLLNKISRTSQSIKSLGKETDLSLRVDLIEMDWKLLEAEAETLISRGSHLNLMTMQNPKNPTTVKLTEIHETLKTEWEAFKVVAEEQRNGVITTSVMMRQYLNGAEKLSNWIGEKEKTLPKVNNEFIKEMTGMKKELVRIGKFAFNLKKENAFNLHEEAHEQLISRWNDLEAALRSPKSTPKKVEPKKVTESPAKKSISHQELSQRISKLRAAISTINRQLDSQLLHVKQHESLHLQEKALDTVKIALDKLKPMLRTTDRDFENIYGSMSIEGVEKLTGLNEKLQKEWKEAVVKYERRKDIWENSSLIVRNLEALHKNLCVGMKDLETKSRYGIKDLSKHRASLSTFLYKSESTKDNVRLNLKTDITLANWDRMFSKRLTSGIETFEFLSSWKEDVQSQSSVSVNSSDLKEMSSYLLTLSIIEREILICQSHMNTFSNLNPTLTSTTKHQVNELSGLVSKNRSLVKHNLDRIQKVHALISWLSPKLNELSERVKRQGVAENLTAELASAKSKVNELAGFHKDISKEADQLGLVNKLMPIVKPLSEKWEEILHAVGSDNIISSELQVSAPKAVQSVETVLSGVSSETNEAVVSRTTYSNSQSSFLSEVAPSSAELIKEMIGEVNASVLGIEDHLGCLKLPVHKHTIIKEALRKLQSYLRDLDAKKTRLDRYVAEVPTENLSSSLRNELETLGQKLLDTKNQLLKRISECTSMVSDSEQFNRKYAEISEVLATNKNPKSQYQSKIFMEICQKMMQNYHSEDISKIEAIYNSVGGGAEESTNGVREVGQRKPERSSMKLEMMMDNFLSWLENAEGSSEKLCKDLQTGRVSTEIETNFNELKDDIITMDCEFNILKSQIDDGRASQYEKMSEISRRWKNLQNKMLSMTGMLANNAAKAKEKQNHRISAIVNWVAGKTSYLSDLKEEHDIDVLKGRLDKLEVLEQEIEEKIILARECKNVSDDAKELLRSLHSLQASVENLKSEVTKAIEEVEILQSCARDIKNRFVDTVIIQATLILTTKFLFRISNIENDLNNSSSQQKILTLIDLVVNLRNQVLNLENPSQKLLEETETLAVQIGKLQAASVEDTSSFNGNTSRPSNGHGNNIDYEEIAYHLPAGWERRTQNDVPYFVNHHEKLTQWDHPIFQDLLDSLLELNNIKFCTYRMASKLRRVQKKLGLELLDLEAAIIGFELHGLSSDRHGYTIQVPEMVIVLTSMFEAVKNEELVEINVALQVDLALNYVLNLFDTQRNGKVRVESFKLCLLLLCGGPLTDKYIQMFHLASNAEGKMSPRMLGCLVYDCMQIPRLFGEVAYFGGTNVEPSIRNCFESVSIDSLDGEVDCADFVRWLKQEPQCLVWLPVHQRLSSAELAKHNVKCKVCKVHPIIGFRYHCIKCFNCDICQNCFFSGKSHKPTHPMKEYCTSTGASEKIKNFGQSVRNSFRGKSYFNRKQQKLSYKPIQSVSEGTFIPPMDSSQSMAPADHYERGLDSRIPSSTDGSFMRNHSVYEQDEHSQIALYCQSLDDNNSIATNPSSFKLEQQINLEEVLQELNQRNARLCQEYEFLANSTRVDSTAGSGENEGIVPLHDNQRLASEEAAKLTQHNARMKARIGILMDHNQQLEGRLQRLRHLLHAPDGSGNHSNKFGTLRTRAVVASSLDTRQSNTVEGMRIIHYVSMLN